MKVIPEIDKHTRIFTFLFYILFCVYYLGYMLDNSLVQIYRLYLAKSPLLFNVFLNFAVFFGNIKVIVCAIKTVSLLVGRSVMQT